MRHRVMAPLRPGSRLSQRYRYLVYVAGIGLWFSGVLWLLFHAFLMRVSAFGPMPHPLEPWWLTVHGAFAFLTLWSFGLIWGVHVAGNWSAGKRRRSGLFLIAILGVLILTGFMLYYVGDEE